MGLSEYLQSGSFAFDTANRNLFNFKFFKIKEQKPIKDFVTDVGKIISNKDCYPIGIFIFDSLGPRVWNQSLRVSVVSITDWKGIR